MGINPLQGASSQGRSSTPLQDLISEDFIHAGHLQLTEPEYILGLFPLCKVSYHGQRRFLWIVPLNEKIALAQPGNNKSLDNPLPPSWRSLGTSNYPYQSLLTTRYPCWRLKGGNYHLEESPLEGTGGHFPFSRLMAGNLLTLTYAIGLVC